jgi:Uma2 family endonuclease
MATVAARPQLDSEELVVHRYSTHDYLRMIEAGVLGPSDKVELIDGIIVRMSPAGSRHNHVLTRLTTIFAPVFDRALPSVQGTLPVTEGQVFDPDFMLLRPRPGGYKLALPTPADVLLVIEVSETSLKRDQQIKLPAYAAAGIADAWIFKTEDESLRVCREPRQGRYASSQDYAGDQSIAPLAISDFPIKVCDVFT